jgi:hypothetical protein
MRDTARRLVTRPTLATLTGVAAAAAFCGAVGLAAGVLDPGPALTGRLPFDSPAFAALTLALAVGVPMTATAVRAVADRPHAGELGMLAGALLVGWTGVQLVVLRAFSWPQPVTVVAGLVVFALGWRVHSSLPPRR